MLQPGCSAHTHLLRSIDDTGVVAELQGTQHRSSHGEHQASRHLQEKGEEKKRGVKLGVPAMPPLSGGGVLPWSSKRRRDARKVVNINIHYERENLLFLVTSTWAKGKKNN